MSAQQSIPCLDFSLFLTGTEEEKQSLCKVLLKGFKDFGFVKLMKHGISDDSIQELFNWVWAPQETPCSLSSERLTSDTIHRINGSFHLMRILR